jgi:seryl-tRNA synthetase
MLDPKQLRQDPQAIADQLKRRSYDLDVSVFHSLESQRVELQNTTQALQTERNKTAKAIGQAKAKGQDVSDIMQKTAHLGDDLKQSEQALNVCQEALLDYQLMIPNLLHASVPDGDSEADNQEIKTWGEPNQCHFEPKDHIALGEALGQMDFEAAAKLSGSRFVVLQNGLARMQRALAQFMLDLHSNEHGYQEVYVPYLVRSEILYGTGQLPKFKDDQFQVAGDHDLTLIPTAEVPLANLVRDTIVDEADLPIKYVAQTPCFRSEAGSYGKDVRGMIRQHQFEKVEMVQLVKPEASYEALDEITRHAETVLERLELPYRRVVLCAADVGFSAAKTFDIEVWMPGQKAYREISSCSNCETFQARRMKARYRGSNGKPQLLHTLNGSGLAVGRTLIAVMENYQDEQGHIKVPEVLRPYMGGLEKIT